MSGNLHTTAPPPGATMIYAEHVAEFIGPRTAPAADPALSVMGVALTQATLTACDQLQAASEAYAAASANLAEATIDLHERHKQLLYGEEAEEARAAHDTALARRVRAEHDFRTADTAQKALRARLYALTALLGRS